MSSTTILIDWKKKVPEGSEKAVNWEIGNTKYQIYAPELKEFDIAIFLPHCIDVRNKILAVVSNDNHKATSLFRAFPRTLSVVFQGIWEQKVQDLPLHPDEADFAASLQEFIAVHVTAEHRQDLLMQLRSAHKPRDMKIQTFYYRLRELNAYIIWMPGHELPLSEEQIKQAFYDAMPTTWRERYINAGKSVHAEDIAQLVRYFQQQENIALSKQLLNEEAMHYRSYNAKQKRRSERSAGKQRTFKRNNSGHQNDTNNKTPLQKKKKIDADIDCPFHPGLHKWGICYENVRNINSPFYKDKKIEKTSKNKQSNQHHVDTTTNNIDESPEQMDFDSSLNLNE